MTKLKSIITLEDVMQDSKVPAFFKKATGRQYSSDETCINDIRRLLAHFWNDKIKDYSDKEANDYLIEVNFNDMVEEMSNKILTALLEEGGKGLKRVVHAYLATVIIMAKEGRI